MWGPAPGIEVLTGAGPSGGGAGEPTRFGEMACDFWTPLLDAETTALA